MSSSRLHSPAFHPLQLGTVQPTGWLRQQLRLQADGLHGHLDEFWPDIRDSQWFGGEAEAWERAPYWLDGLIPLAYTLNDTSLKEKSARYLNHILTHQHDDGWLGPRTMIAAAGQPAQSSYDLWGQILITKVLMQHYDATEDTRALVALDRVLRAIDAHIDRAPLFNWGQFRWFEALLSIFWLYEKSGESWLLDLATKLRAQGFDWRAFFEAPTGWPAREPTPRGRWNYMSHVVNNAMAPKAPALWWRLSGNTDDQRAAATLIDQLMRHHGMVTGVFSGDECLAGRRPTQGTELCAVVEFAFSLEVLLTILGDPGLGDHLERVMFNALPAACSPDMWAHQYDQQVNQVLCTSRDDRIWTTNGPEANLFGVEPNYGCCTANFGQGWPKFAAHLWMVSADDRALVATAYAPSRVQVIRSGVPVNLEIETDYPFKDNVGITITAARPVRFQLWLRIPGWASGATLKLPQGEQHWPEPGTFHKVEGTWEGTTNLTLTLPMQARLERRYRGAATVKRGPLTYALKIEEHWKRVHAKAPYRELPHADWEVYPGTPWNYALAVSEASVPEKIGFQELPIGVLPFSPEGAPITAQVRGRRLDDWRCVHGSAADPPASPARSHSPMETLTLIPYGCTNLRITEFPTTEQSQDQPSQPSTVADNQSSKKEGA